MSAAITAQLESLASLLGPLSPFTKAVVPAALSVATSLVTALFAGHFSPVSLTIAGSGLVIALVTYFLPNLEHKPATPAAPVVAPKVAATAASEAPSAPKNPKPSK